MSQAPLQVMVVVGSLQQLASTRSVLQTVVQQLIASGAQVDLLDLAEEPLPLFNPDTASAQTWYPNFKARVERADVYVLGTPDYHGCVSGALKNFLDHFWEEFAGKLFATVVASHDKGLTVSDQLRTFARQCYAWSLPYAVSFADKVDVHQGEIINDAFRQRLEMLVRDLRVYGGLLAAQRRSDLGGTDPGFLARYRK